MDSRVIADHANVVGENPLWDSTEGCLYWCGHEDDEIGRLFRYDPASGASEMIHETDYIGGFTLQKDGSLLLFMAGGRIARWDGEEELLLETDVDNGAPDILFNDVIADPEGRVFCGTRYSDERDGGLYCLETDGTVRTVESTVGLANGLGFTPDLSRLYFTDSAARRIYIYDYDRSDGTVENRRTFVEVASDDGLPDGMTVDAEGYVWSAHAFGGCVVRYAPDGTEDRRIEFPVGLITSVMFGGADFDSLYVTSGGGQNKDEYGEDAGALFRIDPGVHGVKEHRSNVTV